MRKHLTTLRWYEDRLCSLSSRFLFVLSVASVAVLALVGGIAQRFSDDLIVLLSEGDAKAVLISFDLLLLTSSALWLLSCTLGALIRRMLLRLKGL